MELNSELVNFTIPIPIRPEKNQNRIAIPISIEIIRINYLIGTITHLWYGPGPQAE